MSFDVFQSLLEDLFQFLLFLFLVSFVVLSDFLLVGELFFLNEVLFSFVVEVLDRLQVVVRSSESLDVNAHAFEHLVLVLGGVHLEDISVVGLKELHGWLLTILMGELGRVVIMELMNFILQRTQVPLFSSLLFPVLDQVFGSAFEEQG